MRKILLAISTYFLLIPTSDAQEFTGYQPLNTHSISLLIGWQGNLVYGMGYNYHFFNFPFKSTSDLHLHFLMPFKDAWSWNNIKFNGGFSMHIPRASKVNLGTGIHFSYVRRTNDKNQQIAYTSGQITLMPGLARTFSSLALVADYEMILSGSSYKIGNPEEKTKISGFPMRLGVGIYGDVLYEKGTGLSIFGTYDLMKDKKDELQVNEENPIQLVFRPSFSF